MIDLSKLGTITSKFGNRQSPTAGGAENHKGLDVVLKDPNVPAAFGGFVVDVGATPARGNYVIIQGADGVKARYQHLAAPVSLPKGTKVYEGNKIGVMGTTGDSTGKHLHIELMKDGAYLDPLKFFQGGKNETIQSPDPVKPSSAGMTRLEMESGAKANEGFGDADIFHPIRWMKEKTEGAMQGLFSTVITLLIIAAVVFLGYKFFMQSATAPLPILNQ